MKEMEKRHSKGQHVEAWQGQSTDGLTRLEMSAAAAHGHGGAADALVIAAKLNLVAEVERLLAEPSSSDEQYGLDPNDGTVDGFTPLLVAAQEGHDAVVELLLAVSLYNISDALQTARMQNPREESNCHWAFESMVQSLTRISFSFQTNTSTTPPFFSLMYECMPRGPRNVISCYLAKDVYHKYSNARRFRVCLIIGPSRGHQPPRLQRQHSTGASSSRRLRRALQCSGSLASPS